MPITRVLGNIRLKAKSFAVLVVNECSQHGDELSEVESVCEFEGWEGNSRTTVFAGESAKICDQ